MGLLDNKVAVVTGSGRGIGKAIAETFVKEGAKVAVNDIDAEVAEQTVKELEMTAGKGCAIACVGSVADPKFTDEMMAKTAESFGKIDILVNNAGITQDKVAHKMTDDQWELVIDVNLRGTFNCIRSIAPYFRDPAKKEKEEGVIYHRKIVNFHSTAAIRGNPGQINYTAAKYGNIGMTRTMAQEWGPFLVNVNCVGPGLTRTRLTQPKEESGSNMGIPQAQLDAMIARIPFQRMGEPEDIANAVLFFSSPLSDYVTGQDINVSGGMQIP